VNRLTRLVAAGAAASIAVLGAVSAASASTHPSSAAAAAKASAARAALRYVTAGTPATDQAIPGARSRVSGLTKVESGNWSGYANDNTTGKTYSKVAADWTVPKITCPTKEDQLAAFWVGIDGYSSSSVEQDGTLIECYGGTAYYYTWWEMYPTNDIQVVGDTLRPGDSISASVVRSGTSYTLAVTDSSRSGDSFSTKQSCSCANSSAEWIAEAPSGSSGVEPLSHFSTCSLTSATVKTTSKSGTISSFTDDEITMVDSSGRVEAQPGALNGSGNAFSVTWERST
jgi:hypothetical protein